MNAPERAKPTKTIEAEPYAYPAIVADQRSISTKHPPNLPQRPLRFLHTSFMIRGVEKLPKTTQISPTKKIGLSGVIVFFARGNSPKVFGRSSSPLPRRESKSGLRKTSCSRQTWTNDWLKGIKSLSWHSSVLNLFAGSFFSFPAAHATKHVHPHARLTQISLPEPGCQVDICHRSLHSGKQGAVQCRRERSTVNRLRQSGCLAALDSPPFDDGLRFLPVGGGGRRSLAAAE